MVVKKYALLKMTLDFSFCLGISLPKRMLKRSKFSKSEQNNTLT